MFLFLQGELKCSFDRLYMSAQIAKSIKNLIGWSNYEAAQYIKLKNI
jgi:hypothetical protein